MLRNIQEEIGDIETAEGTEDRLYYPDSIKKIKGKPIRLIQQSLFNDIMPKPLIIPRPRHCISRKSMDKDALRVLYGLKDNGYTSYLVGGSVRDLLLGKPPKDFDIGTNARPHEIKKIFRRSRIIGKRFRIVHVYFGKNKIIEVSTFRRQTEFDDREALLNGMSDEEIYGSPMEDAFRRDITINGLFYNIEGFSVIDFVGGVRDLERGIIRAIGEPSRRFLRDPVRMMRAVRHAARTGFMIEERTWEAICQHAAKIALCSIPRVRDEWLKDIKSGYSSIWMDYLLKSGLFEPIFPVYSRIIKKTGNDAIKLLKGLLRAIDKRVMEDGQDAVSDPLVLSFLLYPALRFHPLWRRFKSTRLRWPTIEIRALIDEIIAPYDFRRWVRDETSQILSNQFPIGLCHSQSRLPKRVWSKAVFLDALFLYNTVRAIEDKDVFEIRGIDNFPVRGELRHHHGKRAMNIYKQKKNRYKNSKNGKHAGKDSNKGKNTE